MKNLKILFVNILILIAFSCSKDDNNQAAAVVDNTLLLKKTIDSDDNLIASYTYDSSKRLINYVLNGNVNNAPRNQNFIYNSDGTLDQIINVSNGSIDTKYFYDNDKKLIKKEGRGGVDIYTYVYSANQVTENYLFTPMLVERKVIYKYDANGNAIEVKEYDNISAVNPSGTLNTTIIYTYDTKNSPFKSFPKEYLFPVNNFNNKQTEKFNTSAVVNYIWEYNDKNFPKKRTTSFVRTYEYL